MLDDGLDRVDHWSDEPGDRKLVGPCGELRLQGRVIRAAQLGVASKPDLTPSSARRPRSRRPPSMACGSLATVRRTGKSDTCRAQAPFDRRTIRTPQTARVT